jgi:hypothetical protein
LPEEFEEQSGQAGAGDDGGLGGRDFVVSEPTLENW